MSRNLLLSFIISFFSFLSFLFFMVESYFLLDKVNTFVFLLLEFIVIFIFSIILVFFCKKRFVDRLIYKELAVSFLIIMVSLLLINLLEMFILKLGVSNPIYFIVSILQTLRLTFEFSIPIYFLVNILEFVRSKLFKKEKYEKVGC